MRKFKGTKGPWFTLAAEQPVSNYSHTISSPSGCVGYWKGHKDWHDDLNWVLTKEDADLIAAAPDLLEALQWALPLAKIAMDTHRMERIKCGHMDISGTYKNGETWVGIWQTEVDQIEFAQEAINKALGENND